MKIFLDDVRDPFPWMIDEGGWVTVRSSEEFLKLLADHTLAGIEAISFDNDLGTPGLMGYELLDKIEAMVEAGESRPEIYVHTANPVAAKRMYETLRRMGQARPRIIRRVY